MRVFDFLTSSHARRNLASSSVEQCAGWNFEMRRRPARPGGTAVNSITNQVQIIYTSLMNLPIRFLRTLALCAALSVPTHLRAAGETNAVESPAAKPATEANVADLQRSYLQLQEQLHSAQLAIERNRLESEAAATRNAEAAATPDLRVRARPEVVGPSAAAQTVFRLFADRARKFQQFFFSH